MQRFFYAVATVVRKAFFVAEFNHGVGGRFFHDFFKAVCDTAYEESRIFVCKAAAGGYIAVGVNVENVAGTFAVIVLEPAAGLPGARVF